MPTLQLLLFVKVTSDKVVDKGVGLVHINQTVAVFVEVFHEIIQFGPLPIGIVPHGLEAFAGKDTELLPTKALVFVLVEMVPRLIDAGADPAVLDQFVALLAVDGAGSILVEVAEDLVKTTLVRFEVVMVQNILDETAEFATTSKFARIVAVVNGPIGIDGVHDGGEGIRHD